MATAPIPIPAAAAPARPPAAPATPGRWSWRCHMCGCCWPLSSAKCLDVQCGHARCSRREGQPANRLCCTVQFEAAGWRADFDWRRHIEAHGALVEAGQPHPGAAANQAQAQAQNAGVVPVPMDSRPSADNGSAAGPLSSFADHLLSCDPLASPSAAAPPPLPSPRLSSPSPARAARNKSSSPKPARRRRIEHVRRPSPLNPAWRPADRFI
ncbi:hypothetical protein CCMA1212_010733 [Trichoderma ghanense]|uniref:Uncharacterized protein n=1 Tax=Trichoderma ghanense TaxID=65468 RepID=A0ABY2GPW5_9HYPO